MSTMGTSFELRKVFCESSRIFQPKKPKQNSSSTIKGKARGHTFKKLFNGVLKKASQAEALQMTSVPTSGRHCRDLLHGKCEAFQIALSP